MIKPFKGKNPNHEKFFIPRSVQQSIPIKKVHKDGVFEVAGLYSKTWRFFDVNYAVAGPEKKEALFLSYCAFLNSLPVRALVKITLFNRTMNQQEFSRNILMQMVGDGKDRYRAEYNDILTDNAASSNNLTQEKYITISVERKNIEEARAFFNRVGTELGTYLSRMDVKVRDTNVVERMRLFHDFFRPLDSDFRFDLNSIIHRGNDFRDAIAPDCLTFYKDHYEMGDQVGRVLFLRDYASFIKDEMITELSDLPRNMMISINLLPIPTDEVVKEIQRRIMAIESDVGRFTQRQNSLNNFNATIPYHLEQSRLQTRELMDDVTTRDQGLMLGQVTITHLADTLEQLDQDTETLVSIGQGRGCQISTLKYQQEDGLNTVLPYGLQRVDAMRSLTTESTAVLMPFKAQEIQDKGGVYYGINAVSHNLIICNRANLLNGNGFILGVSGSGKSMAAKQELTSLMLGTDHDIIVVDPEREYGPLVRALGGEVITISASSDQCSYINALDLSAEYGDGKNPLVLKSEFIMSLCEQLMGSGQVGAKEKSIIDRCTAQCYHDYVRDGCRGQAPTLQDFHAELLRQPEAEARDVALALELFTEGSLNTFAKPTNVDMSSRIACYDIRKLGKQLLSMGMLVILDSFLNRITRNRRLGRNTWIYIDEIYLLFQHEYSANFLFTLWKRVRKYGACCTGLTQNVDDLLQSHTARTMLANSEFLVMLNQASTDRLELARLLNISDNQLSYITNVDFGRGLIKCGSAIVPFMDNFPRHTQLYKLMTTKPSDLAA